MGVGKNMKTFFAAMNEQVGVGGYGSKIKTTPMGPFKWNDMLQLWENVNNGMAMNNISFQEMFNMSYESSTGDNGTAGPDYTPSLSPSSWGSISITATNRTTWANGSGGSTIFANGTAVTFSGINRTILIDIEVTRDDEFGDSLQNVKYSIDSGAITTWSGTSIQITNGQNLRIAATSPNVISIGNSGNLLVTNASDGGALLASIPYTFGLV